MKKIFYFLALSFVLIFTACTEQKNNLEVFKAMQVPKGHYTFQDLMNKLKKPKLLYNENTNRITLVGSYQKEGSNVDMSIDAIIKDEQISSIFYVFNITKTKSNGRKKVTKVFFNYEDHLWSGHDDDGTIISDAKVKEILPRVYP